MRNFTTANNDIHYSRANRSTHFYSMLSRRGLTCSGSKRVLVYTVGHPQHPQLFVLCIQSLVLSKHLPLLVSEIAAYNNQYLNRLNFAELHFEIYCSILTKQCGERTVQIAPSSKDDDDSYFPENDKPLWIFL